MENDAPRVGTDEPWNVSAVSRVISAMGSINPSPLRSRAV